MNRQPLWLSAVGLFSAKATVKNSAVAVGGLFLMEKLWVFS